MSSHDHQRPATRVLGLFCDGWIPGPSGVFGAQVATETLIEAVLRHAKLRRCEVFANPSAEDEIAGQLRQHRRALAGASANLTVRPYDDLAGGIDGLAVSTWLEAGAHMRRALYARERLARTVYPVVCTTYTVSYQHLLHDWFLPVLLSDVRPGDAIVCNGHDVAKSTAELISGVADRFNSAHGTRLHYRGRVDVIPVGVDTGVFRPRDKAEVRRELGLPIDATVILWVGRFSVADKMDLMPLVRTFGRLVKGLPRERLLMVLAGSDTGGYGTALWTYACELGLSEHLGMLYDVPKRYRHMIHAAADVFVSPSDNVQEAFGITPIEAMASGVPQVVAAWDGYKEAVLDGVTGLLVPTLWADCASDVAEASELADWRLDHLRLGQSVAVDMDAMYRALQRLVLQPAVRGRMAHASRQRALSEYSWPVVVARYEALWTDLEHVAAREPAPRADPASYRVPQYWRAFGHYASLCVGPNTNVTMTRSGRAVLRGRDALLSQPDVAPTLDRGFIRVLLASATLRRNGKPLPVGELLTTAGTLTRSTACGARNAAYEMRHVLWLLKYGLLRRVQ